MLIFQQHILAFYKTVMVGSYGIISLAQMEKPRPYTVQVAKMLYGDSQLKSDRVAVSTLSQDSRMELRDPFPNPM